MASFSAKDYSGTQTYFLVASGTGVIGDPYIQTISLSTGSNTIGAVNIAAAQTLATVTTVTSLTQMNGQAIAMGTGVRSAGTQRVTIATDDVVPASQSGTWSMSDIPTTSGGRSVYSFLSTAAVQTAQVKGSAGQLYSLEIFNTSATIAYVRIYNQTGAPASTDNANIIARFAVPASTSGAGFVKDWPNGIACSTGIGIRITAAVSDTDTTALAANVVLGNVTYK